MSQDRLETPDVNPTIDISEVRQKTVVGVMSYAFRTLALYLVAIVASGILAAYLTPDEYGVYYVVLAVIGLFTFLSDVGLAAALVQKKGEPTTAEMRTTFTVQQVLALLIVGLIVLLTPVWKTRSGLGEDGITLLYALAASFILASLKTIPSILLERKLEFNKLVIPQVVEQILFYSIAVVLAIRGYGVSSYTYAVLARSIAGVIVIYFIQGWPIGLAISKKALKRLLQFGAKFQLNDLLARIKDDLLVVVLPTFLSQTQIGYFGWARQWSKYPYQFSVQNVIAVTFPTFSRLQEHKEVLRRAIEKSLFFITLIIFPVLMGMSVMAWPLTQLIPRYQQWIPALPSLYLFAFSIAWAAVSTPLTNTLNALGEINKTLYLMVMWTVLTWILTPVGIFLFGTEGVALAAAVVSTTSIVTVWMVKKTVQFSFLDQIWRQIVATLGMGGLLLFRQSAWAGSWPRFFLGVLFGGLVYVAAMLILGRKMVIKEISSLIKK